MFRLSPLINANSQIHRPGPTVLIKSYLLWVKRCFVHSGNACFGIPAVLPPCLAFTLSSYLYPSLALITVLVPLCAFSILIIIDQK